MIIISDSSSELNGKNYDLQSSSWDSEIIESVDSITVNLTLAGLADNVIIQFLITVSIVSSYLPGTNDLIMPFSEAKIEIVIKNWKYSAFAQGLALKAEISERMKVSNISYDNGTVGRNGLHIRSIQILSDNYMYNPEKAFVRWLTSADYYNGTELLFDLPMGNAYFNETTDGYNDDSINLWMSYQNYADSLTINHITTFGLYKDEETYYPTALTPISNLSFIAVLMVANVIIFIFYRKKGKRN